jgi:hypothetical protein
MLLEAACFSSTSLGLAFGDHLRSYKDFFVPYFPYQAFEFKQKALKKFLIDFLLFFNTLC